MGPSFEPIGRSAVGSQNAEKEKFSRVSSCDVIQDAQLIGCCVTISSTSSRAFIKTFQLFECFILFTATAIVSTDTDVLGD